MDKAELRETINDNLFVKCVLSRLKRAYTIEDDDLDSIKQGIRQAKEMVMTVDQAYRYAKNFEEVNPDLIEEWALARMKAVRDELVFEGRYKGKRVNF